MSRKIILATIILFFLFGLTTLASAKIVTIDAEGSHLMGDRDTKVNARMFALMEAKRMGLEKVGTYVESTTIVTDYKVTKDEIITYAAGIVKVNQVSEEWGMEGETPVVTIKAELIIDTDILKDRVGKFESDRIAKEKLEKVTRAFNEGYEYFQAEQYKQALASFNIAIDNSMNEYDLYYWRGRTHEELKNYKIALKDFTTAIELNPQEADKAICYELRAITYKYLEDYKNALNDINRAIELDSSNDEFYLYRAYIYNDLKDYNSALKDINKLIELDPHESIYFAVRSRIYMGFEDYNNALKDMAGAIKLNPQNGDYYAARADIYRVLEDYNKAIKDYDKAIELTSQEATHYYYYYYRATIYSQKGDQEKNRLLGFLRYKSLRECVDSEKAKKKTSCEEALRYYEKAIEDYKRADKLAPKGTSDWKDDLYGSIAEAYSKRSNCYAQLNQPEKALEEIDKALEYKSDEIDYYQDKAKLLYELKEYHKAKELLYKIIAEKPKENINTPNGEKSRPSLDEIRDAVNYEASCLLLMRTLVELEEYEEVIGISKTESFKTSIYQSSQKAYLLGLASWKLENYNEAKKHFKICFSDDLYLFRFLSKEKKYCELDKETKDAMKAGQLSTEEAIGIRMQRLFREIPDDKSYFWVKGIFLGNISRAYQSEGFCDKAMETINRALTFLPDDGMLYITRGGIYEALKQYDKALEDYTNAIELRPSSKNHRTRGNLYEKLKQYDKALEDYTNAIELHPSRINHRTRGNLYEKLKQYDKALEDYTSLIEIHSSRINYEARGKLYKKLGQDKKAQEDFSKAKEPNELLMFDFFGFDKGYFDDFVKEDE